MGIPQLSGQVAYSRLPSEEKLTECTQPPPLGEFENSARSWPIGILEPHGVAEGFGSISFMYPENTRTLKSVDPVARSTLLGCQSSDVTVDFRGFLMCLATHQSLSFS